jgi:polyhydroxyalkanoate synthesis regulator phasin
MPQPKKSGSSARKPAARKHAAKKPAAAKPARKRAAPGQQQARAAARSAASDPGDGTREDQLQAAIASLRDMLSKGIVITTDRLQETVDEAVRRGRMTRQDAEELVQNLYAIGRRQAQDTLTELEGLVERSAKETRRQARARAKDVGAAARRAPGTDRALRTVDRVRRAAGLGPAFPVIGYDDLTAAQVKERLEDLNAAELRKVRDHERRNANRKSVLTAIERKLQ